MDVEEKLKVARKQAAGYALALDFTARITRSDSEKEVIESILEFINMMFLPEVLYYFSLKNDMVQQVYTLTGQKDDQEILKRFDSFESTTHAWTESGKGFRVKINSQMGNLGFLEVDRVKFSSNKSHYLNLTLSLTDVCGLALENARRSQRLKDTSANLRKEKENLEKALAKVKTLSGLLPICSYCKKIRDDSGYWNQIEHYIDEHSEVEFSHSICKECSDELLSDLDVYSEP